MESLNYLPNQIPASYNDDLTLDFEFDFDLGPYIAPAFITPTRNTPTAVHLTTPSFDVTVDDDLNTLFIPVSPGVLTSSSLDDSGYHSPSNFRSQTSNHNHLSHSYSALASVCDDVTTKMTSLESRLMKLAARFPCVTTLQDFYHQMSASARDPADLLQVLERVSQSLDLVESVQTQSPVEETVRQSQFASSAIVGQSSVTRGRKRQHMKSSSTAKSRRISPAETEILEAWYARHIRSPYPSTDQLTQLSHQCQLARAQIKKWLSNKRSRSGNCRPKRKYSFYGSVHGLVNLCTDEYRQ